MPDMIAGGFYLGEVDAEVLGAGADRGGGERLLLPIPVLLLPLPFRGEGL